MKKNTKKSSRWGGGIEGQAVPNEREKALGIDEEEAKRLLIRYAIM